MIIGLLLSFIWLQAEPKNDLKKRLSALAVQYTDASAIELSRIWDSLYFGASKPYMYQFVPEYEWQEYFEKRLTRGISDSAGLHKNVISFKKRFAHF